LALNIQNELFRVLSALELKLFCERFIAVWYEHNVDC
jgi:hypothetical protein